MKTKKFLAVYDPDENKTHIQSPPTFDQVTLCGQTDWIGNKCKADYGTSLSVDCSTCLRIADYCAARTANRVPDPEVLDTLKACADLFAADHAISRFDWGKSFLRAQDIRELNELPGRIKTAIDKVTNAN